VSGLTFAAFIAAQGPAGAARVIGAPIAPDDRFIPGTDSRALVDGESFVCLRGPHFDGHDHIDEAVRRGARAVVADDPSKVRADLPVPAIVVADTMRAFMRGAAAARERTRTIVIGITGSVGKTTTTSMCAQLAARSRRVLATPRNENNELGVSKLCYRLSEDYDVAVVEMGARGPGQIAELVEIARPDVGVLTNVAEAHLEFFEGREALAREKFALFSGGARPVLSAADEWSRTLAAEAGLERSALWIRLCGDPQCEGLALEAGGPRDGRVPVSFGASHAFARWHLAGEQHLRDALLAAAAAILAGLTFEEAIAGFGDLRLPAGRFERHVLQSGATVVYDAYNASPASMAHALRAFAEIPAARHIAVLGSMAELGPDAAALHEETGAAAARSGIDALFFGGAFADALARGARQAGMDPAAVTLYSDNAEVAASLRATVAAGDAVLLKGSRVQRMEEILDLLTAQSAAAS
jgi:UDP-N-acetylmuramoyl-tripeptide--D-alanyl-D-alanine ligase